jgi:hypothetical protein
VFGPLVKKFKKNENNHHSGRILISPAFEAVVNTTKVQLCLPDVGSPAPDRAEVLQYCPASDL